MQIVVFLLFVIIPAALVILANYIYLKRKGEKIEIRQFLPVAVILVFYSMLFTGFQIYWNSEIRQLKEKQAQEVLFIKRAYAKELALVEWKNKVFTSEKEMEIELTKCQTEHRLSTEEVRMWRNVAENNTIEKLMPKSNTKDVLKEYRERLKKSLTAIRSGKTLMNSDIRMLSDNINTIRLIGKEYEKVLGAFRELYDNIVVNCESGTIMTKPKQKKFLFFPIKQREYEELLNQYYQNQGNKTVAREIAEKLRITIDQAETEFRTINRKFEDNMAFLENTSSGIIYNSDKLENLIEAAINEADIVTETSAETTVKVNKKKKN
ncbi:MAG: hypothetical protein ACM3WV_08860 [Bacillota bacterium]